MEKIDALSLSKLVTSLKKRTVFLNKKGALHHCPPSGGGWGVVRVACLVPEVEILFVIPMGCGRHGAIASFANQTVDKITYLLVEEVDLVSGNHLSHLEEAMKLLIEEKNPKGLIVCSTCMDDLLGSDYESVERFIEEMYDVPIRHGKMNPILSESKKAPELMIQKTIYEFWGTPLDLEKKKKNLNLLGSFCDLHESAEIIEILNKMGIGLKHISRCKSFIEFCDMENSMANLLICPNGIVAANHLDSQNHQPYIEALQGFCEEEIDKAYREISVFLKEELHLETYKSVYKNHCERVKKIFKGKTVAVGSTINARPFELAHFLTTLGFEVAYIVAKAIPQWDVIHVKWLELHSPKTLVLPNLDPKLAFCEAPVDRVDYVFGLDVLGIFETIYLIELPFDEQLFGFGGAVKLIERIEKAKPFCGSLSEKIYSANLVI